MKIMKCQSAKRDISRDLSPNGNGRNRVGIDMVGQKRAHRRGRIKKSFVPQGIFYHHMDSSFRDGRYIALDETHQSSPHKLASVANHQSSPPNASRDQHELTSVNSGLENLHSIIPYK